MSPKKLIALILLIVLACLILSPCIRRETYRFLGGTYDVRKGGFRSELNEECLQLQAGQQCMMIDGTPGNCVMSGHCVANMLIDLNEEAQDVPKPYCTKPVFKGQCASFCACQKLKGESFNEEQCMDNCLSWFSPL